MRGLSFDIFCRVIDNFGDIGVCWRLARQLAHRPEGWNVRLWVDDLGSFSRIEPMLDPAASRQTVHGIEIVHWTALAPRLTPAAVVIEAFGCEPPARFVQDMRVQDSLWINLEYLSAEPWVESCHAQPSIQNHGLRKTFFFPGFTRGTGGLLREPDLLPTRDRWLAQPRLRDELLQTIGLPQRQIQQLRQGGRQVFLFCYGDAPAQALIDSLRQQAKPTVLIVPEGVLPSLKTQTNERVYIHRAPFVTQDAFDRLLWSSDLNFVRGEDSLVRALWAGKPLVWQIYRQEQDAHLVKLQAWLGLHPFGAALHELMMAWNTGAAQIFAQELNTLLQTDAQATWQAASLNWARKLAEQTDLAESLVDFCAKELRTG